MGLLDSGIKRTLDREKFWRAREFFLEEGALKQSTHGLRGGEKADYYFDIDNLLNDPIKCQVIAAIYVDLIGLIADEDKVDLLAFIEKASGGTIGALRLAGTLSIATRIPNIVVRPGKAIYFEKVKVPFWERGEMGIKRGLRGLRVVIVTDHCSSGREAITAKKILEKMGAESHDVVSFTKRPDLFEERTYEQEGVRLFSAFSLPNLGQVSNLREDINQFVVNF